MYPANRAMVYLKMQKWEEAEKDCSTALDINPKYAKAFDRRGQARVELKRYKEANEDFIKAKEYDPKTKNVDKNIEETKKKMEEEDEATEKEKKNESTNKEEEK